MFVPPSVGSPLRPRASALPPPISTRALRSADRSARSGAGFGNLFGANPLTWLVGPLINWTVNRSAARARVAGVAGGHARRRSRPSTARSSRRLRRPRPPCPAISRRSTAATRFARRATRREKAATDHARPPARGRHQLARTARCRAHRCRGRSRIWPKRMPASPTAQVDLFKALGGGWDSRYGHRSSCSAGGLAR